MIMRIHILSKNGLPLCSSNFVSKWMYETFGFCCWTDRASCKKCLEIKANE